MYAVMTEPDEEAEGLALYARLREEARERVAASAPALLAIPRKGTR